MNIQTFKTLSFDDQYSFLVKCSNAYYESGNPIVSDELFDLLVDQYELTSNKSFNYLGKTNHKKIQLPVYMGSLDKIKTSDKISQFLNKCSSNKIIYSAKMDGLSLLLFSDSKNNFKLATRGDDGKIGSDVSHLLSHLKLQNSLTLLSKVSINCIVRGEIIMKKSVFKKHYPNASNARNTVCGIVNSKNLDIKAVELCTFVAYSLPGTTYTQEETFAKLKELKFEIPEMKLIDKTKSTVDYLSNVLSTLKIEYDYEIDGIVLSDNIYHKENIGENPKYTVAFKHNIETTQATVVDVLWEASRYGLLKPRIQINPVDLNGVKITYLTGFHAQYIKENKIGKNTVLQICRSGDVIPHILSVVKSTEAKFPPKDEYEWTDSVDIKTKLNNDDNLSVKLAYFLGVCGAKGVKEGVLQKCIDIGIKDITSLLKVKKEVLLKAEGIGEKMSDKMIEQFNIVKSNLTLLNIMLGSCVFERFGEKKLEKILEVLPECKDIVLKDVLITQLKSNWILKMNSIGIKTQADTFIDMFETFKKEWSSFCKEFLVSSIQIPSTSTISIKVDKKCDWNVVFTGVRDKDLEKVIESYGGKVTDSVSSKTTYLVVKELNPESRSSKMDKAESLNVRILTLEQIKNLVNKL
jgi:NAD-dependent DNA ligase